MPVGSPGELVVRPNEPSIIADGYLGMPEATMASRRNLWFHTGDLLRRDADGFFSFVGRLTDSIRRRGENISAFEVEEVVKLHPDVLDAAAYGVPSELTEDDVMVAVVARPGCADRPADSCSRSVPTARRATWCPGTSTWSTTSRARPPRRCARRCFADAASRRPRTTRPDTDRLTGRLTACGAPTTRERSRGQVGSTGCVNVDH